MKKKFYIINLLMSITVLFAMLFQTIHSYEHVYKQITEKQCEHDITVHKNQITHHHSVENNCPICHFTFSTYIPNAFLPIFLKKVINVALNVFFYNQTPTSFFKGSLFALRGPPSII